MNSVTNGPGKISFKKWAMTVLSAIVIGVAFVTLVNCLVDAYGILRTDFSRQFQEPNQRFVKMKYLLRNKDKYDSFLFGSSRALQMNVKNILNGRYYNMGYSEGLPQEHLENTRLLLKEGHFVKNLLISIDDFSYRVAPEQHYADLLRQQHYLVSGKTRLDFYSGYFLKKNRFFSSLRRYIKHNFTKEGRTEAKRTYYDFYDSGRVICTTCDEEIEADLEKHLRDPKFTKPYHYDGDNKTKTLESLRALVTLAKEHNINLIIFINPIHKTTYLDTDLPLFLEFKRQLAEITPYYDFSGLNSITIDNYYYHETSHFREMVGNMMFGRMFDYPQPAVPGDFGVFVTARNVNDHLKRERERFIFSRTAGH